MQPQSGIVRDIVADRGEILAIDVYLLLRRESKCQLVLDVTSLLECHIDVALLDSANGIQENCSAAFGVCKQPFQKRFRGFRSLR